VSFRDDIGRAEWRWKNEQAGKSGTTIAARQHGTPAITRTWSAFRCLKRESCAS